MIMRLIRIDRSDETGTNERFGSSEDGKTIFDNNNDHATAARKKVKQIGFKLGMDCSGKEEKVNTIDGSRMNHHAKMEINDE